jgi:NitT/TauT family transport system substrate-binding protein
MNSHGELLTKKGVPMRRPHAHWFSISLATTALAAGLAACSAGSSSQVSGSGDSGPLTTVTVAAPNIASAVPLQIALDKGLFKAEGLNVKVEIVANSNATTAPLLAGTLDFTSENWVGMYIQEMTNPKLGLKVIADNFQATDNIAAIVVPKGSKITSVKQLAGKNIALPGKGTSIGPLSVDVLLNSYGVKATAASPQYKTVVTPFPDMPAVLAQGKVDAAWVTEPFVTVAEEAGAHVLAYTYNGALKNFPIGPWATTESFADKNPQAVKEFTAAITKAQQMAASDPALVRTEEPVWIKTLKPAIANVMAQGTYDSTVNLTSLQRVADVMEDYGFLPASFNSQLKSFITLPSGA